MEKAPPSEEDGAGWADSPPALLDGLAAELLVTLADLARQGEEVVHQAETDKSQREGVQEAHAWLPQVELVRPERAEEEPPKVGGAGLLLRDLDGVARLLVLVVHFGFLLVRCY